MSSAVLDSRKLYDDARGVLLQDKLAVGMTNYSLEEKRVTKYSAAVNLPQQVMGSDNSYRRWTKISVASAATEAKRNSSTDSYQVLAHRLSNLSFEDVVKLNRDRTVKLYGDIKFPPEAWNCIFAYLDFDSHPVYVAIVALAESYHAGAPIPARRVFWDRCRKYLNRLGLATLDGACDVIECKPEQADLLSVAQRIAYLEEQVARDGYLSAAIEFEGSGEIRSALSCVYRNVRFRVRDCQIEELNRDLASFEVQKASVDSMLAVLTATLPLKKRLSNRPKLFTAVQKSLKNRRGLGTGLLDGLK
jgi:hypothetical protein